MTAERNIKLSIAFDGTDFNGWQRQKHDVTIQGEIEKCLATMTNCQTDLHGAGRTDAGVHADQMIAHFSTTSGISTAAFRKGLNSMLPYAIRILAAEEVPLDFHSRFSAKGKQYQYSLYTGEVMPPTERLYALHAPFYLDFDRIRECLDLLIGTHDFSSFENSGSRDKEKESRKGAVRTIMVAKVDNLDKYRYNFTFIGEGFLRHMVRNIVGTLLEVGKGRRTVNEFGHALQAKDRSAGGATAPAHGLRLIKVLY
ncbi:tRNA pseudouridine(38-40) synthase TruA [Desulfosediminicola ganghwensis]|uniref:tRNA pseudouridine(38-40) synthase TruA n=1 Tax=Desulfosediminicola ganghwensis TaxID=2569540 RepID=UPI0010AB572A|nr:tRNA pseudouridine(38-40) synthase TruA [Desulfosediminicola ganghwensis]